MRRWLPKFLRRAKHRAPDPEAARAFDVQEEIVRAAEPVVFDVGAHVGSVAREYRRRFPSAYIHCFEPFPPSFEKLRRHLEGDQRVALHPLALAASEGVALIHVNASSATNSLLASDTRASAYWGPGLLDTQRRLEVATTTLDTFCGAQGIERIDVLKLDVQGGELSVLKGARRMLSEQRIELVYMELILAPAYEGQPVLDDYLNLFTSHGYRLFALYNQALRRGRLLQADALFLSSRCLDEYEARLP